MRWPNASSAWVRVLALPLALWSAVPGVQWCRVGWADVRLECFAECSIERSECSPSPCPASALPAGDLSAEGCTAGVAECALGPCNPDGGSTDGLPGGRAYCLSGPAGGDGVPSAPPDAAPPVATIPAGHWEELLTDGAGRPFEPVVARPPGPATGSVPRIRAPPRLRSATC